MEKDIDWRGSSLEDLKRFPDDAKRTAGFELNRVQNGHEPYHFKRVDDWGAGVTEIKIKDKDGAWRVIYVAKFEKKIYVLHCFQKKTQKTSPGDAAIIKARYKTVVADIKEAKHD
ncbi:type II toxin-antitoxin system RelE/ParE family toxin [Erwinia sp. V71]|uniref:type II toxin-antitoxin system RelE/ParE family toxin n=1 Tax=Erwinia sp. V71 TaxID=3369424 RepID=UPI003F63811A